MPWQPVTETSTLSEWERTDGGATIRLRARSDGAWTVRLDRLHQSAEGTLYRRETAETREEARRLVDAWQTEFDVPDEE